MPKDCAEDAAGVIFDAIAPMVAGRRGPLILAIAGAQGSGKSTLARALDTRFRADGRRSAALSLDDFYLTKKERLRLAADIHPLFATRGVPGTHDISLAINVLDAVRAGRATRAPSFDKGADDRRPDSHSVVIPADLDILIFEGWCLGAEPAAAADLVAPINRLERTCDQDGTWRRAVNDALAGACQDLFSRFDFLVFLCAPDFEIVRTWRLQQEAALAAEDRSAPALMSESEVSDFIQYFERITRAMLCSAPGRADLTIDLDRERRIAAVSRR